MNEKRGILSVTTEVDVYPSSDAGTFLFSIPSEVLEALQRPTYVYLVIRDVFGNLIQSRQVKLESGPEVRKSDFKNQTSTGQLYPGQRIRLEVSRP